MIGFTPNAEPSVLRPSHGSRALRLITAETRMISGFTDLHDHHPPELACSTNSGGPTDMAYDLQFEELRTFRPIRTGTLALGQCLASYTPTVACLERVWIRGRDER